MHSFALARGAPTRGVASPPHRPQATLHLLRVQRGFYSGRKRASRDAAASCAPTDSKSTAAPTWTRRLSPRIPRGAAIAAGRSITAPRNETRNCGEINRELLLRPEAEVVLGRGVRRCRPTAG